MSLQGNLACLEMMLRSDHEAERYYDLLRSMSFLDAPHGVPMINMGYWRGVAAADPDGLWKATLQLSRLIGETAELGPGDHDVLDVGCGYGTNALACMEAFGPQRIVALNIAGEQIARGRQVLAASRFAARVAFQQGSAVRIPQPDASFDKVVSIEAAFHFPPRSAFLREARRVLRPGGLLAIADLVPVPPTNPLQRGILGVARRILQIPAQNVYGLDRYREELEDAGFAVESITSIRQHVFPHYPQWVLKHRTRHWRDLDVVFAAANTSILLYPWEYVVIRARKASLAPAAPRPAARCPFHTQAPVGGARVGHA